MGGGGKAPSVNIPGPPQPSAQELAAWEAQTRILNRQEELLRRQSREQELLSTILFPQWGIRPIYGSGVQDQVTALQGKIADVRSRMAGVPQFLPIPGMEGGGIGGGGGGGTLGGAIGGVGGAGGGGGLGGGVIGAPLNPAWQTLQDELAGYQKALNPLLARLGDPAEITGFEQIPDPLADIRKDIERRSLERSQAALKGELPVDPALISELDRSESVLRDNLRRQLGTGYETSTPGQEALQSFDKRRQEILEGARRGDLTMAEQMSLGREQQDLARLAAISGAGTSIAGAPFGGISTLGQLAQGFGSQAGAFASQRMSAYDAQVRAALLQAQLAAQYGNKGFNWGGMLGGILGTGVGALFGGIGAPIGSAIGSGIGKAAFGGAGGSF